MRLGVLDVGSNTVHLLVVDAHPGAEPAPQHSSKTVLRLAELIDKRGDLKKDGNGADVLERIRAETGVELAVLTGGDEARLTFLAVRRWYGWSAGRLLDLDIGGGSLELAIGDAEEPEVSLSVPLGAGRLTRERLDGAPPSKSEIAELRGYVDGVLTKPVKQIVASGRPDLACCTSKTFRTLARLAGAAPSGAGWRVRRMLTRDGLRQVSAFITRMTSADLAELDGVSAARAHQTLAGAIVATAAMDALGLTELRLCPWALREGIILRRLDRLSAG